MKITTAESNPNMGLLTLCFSPDIQKESEKNKDGVCVVVVVVVVVVGGGRLGG